VARSAGDLRSFQSTLPFHCESSISTTVACCSVTTNFTTSPGNGPIFFPYARRVRFNVGDGELTRQWSPRVSLIDI